MLAKLQLPVASASRPSHQDAVAPQLVRHFNQVELSRRWKLSPRTLERWRWLGQGPRYLKVGGRVIYRLEDIIEFEAKQLCISEIK